MKFIITRIFSLSFFLTLLFSQNEIEGRWHLVGYEDNVMYQFENNYRYTLYSTDGNFGDLDEAGGSPNPYIIEDDIKLTIARLSLAKIVRIVLFSGLSIIGVNPNDELLLTMKSE